MSTRSHTPARPAPAHPTSARPTHARPTHARRGAAAFPAPQHDHATCVADILARGRDAFEQSGLRLTPLRARVFEEIASSHTAVGAYDVLDRLARKSDKRLAPISVYRAIDALLAAGVVHRLETRNAFFACHAAHAPDRRQLILACDDCGAVAELPGDGVFAAIGEAARGAAFAMAAAIVEVRGCCAHCAARQPEAPPQ